MAQTPITELDFFQLKEQMKAYLRGQSRFKDYDFEGSNMSVLLDILAYNTYQNNFYTNMAVSEMFLDSAQLESSVMSHAKELNYLPRSAISSRAEIHLKISAPSLNNIATLTIPAGQKFTTTHNGVSYNFYTDVAQVASLRAGSTGIYEINCMPVYEGELVSEVFYLSDTSPTAVITNNNVDINSIKVSLNSGTEEFLYRSSIFGVEPSDKVFYVEPTLTGGYEITFGKNTFGREPTFNEDIRVSYRVCSGSAPNGAFKFVTSFSYPTSITIYSAATGGGDKESIASVKYFAPKSIQNQERAITARDYEALIKKEFGSGVVKSVSVYGGDEMNPPRYGKVAVSINPYSGTAISESFKASVISFLSDKTPLPIQPIFVDPEFLYANLKINVYYSKRQTGKSAVELEALVREAIQNYSTTYLNDFGVTLQTSRLSKIIDDIDAGIMSNTILASPVIDYSPQITIRQNPRLSFGTALVVPYAFDVNEPLSNYTPAVKSSPYTQDGIDVFFQDDGRGNIIILSNNTQSIQVLNYTGGNVNYTTGEVNLVNFTTDGYTGSAIKVYANTIERNVVSPKNRIFSVRNTDIVINMIETQ